MGKVNWSKAVDLRLACKNVASEHRGDWYKDPWGWPEYDYILKKDSAIAYDWLNKEGCSEVSLIKVPKENWGVRPAVVLNLVDRLGYQALIDKSSVDLIGDMVPNAFGWRLIPGTPEPGKYARDSLQWDNYRTHVHAAAISFDCLLRTDVVSCFASMRPDVVLDVMDSRTGRTQLTGRVASFLEGFNRVAARDGLPQRARPSSVLANMVMSHFDDVLADHAAVIPELRLPGKSGKSPKGRTSFVRWMDDMYLFGDDAGDMRKAQVDLQDAAASLGLHLNSSKTDLLEGEDVFRVAMEVELSAIDGGLSSGDEAPLEEMVDRVLDSLDTAPRTHVKFMTLRMIKHHACYRRDELLENAVRMPHCADSFSRLFKDSYHTNELQEWFTEAVNGSWSHLQWPFAQYLGMFPSASAVSKSIRDFAAERVADPNTELPLLAVCAQRLAEWDSPSARATISSAIHARSNANERRVLSLAALSAGESRHLVKKWIGQNDENRATYAMLEAGHYSARSVSEAYRAGGPALDLS